MSKWTHLMKLLACLKNTQNLWRNQSDRGSFNVHETYTTTRLEPEQAAPNWLKRAEAAGNPNRMILFGSTSKITFASGGLGIQRAP